MELETEANLLQVMVSLLALQEADQDMHAMFIEKHGYAPVSWDPHSQLVWFMTHRRVSVL